jgi:hypothetical protein
MSTVNFEVGYDLEKFRSYYKLTLASPDYVAAVGENDGTVELRYVTEDPSRLIVWTQEDQIVGHSIWHESNTDEHRNGVPRNDDDRSVLRELLGGRRDFVELHELWLGREHRDKGYGKEFFEFFERFISDRGYEWVVHHAFDQAVLAICRSRGYKEAYGVKLGEPTNKTCWVLCLSLKRT